MVKIVFAGDRLFLKFPDLGYFHKRLAEIGGSIVGTDGMDEDAFLAEVEDADAVVLIAKPITKNVIAHMKKCRLIQTLSVGYDCVDVQAAVEKGIPVSNSPTYCSTDVANHAMTLLLAVSRKLQLLIGETDRAGWDYKVGKPIFRYEGKKLGIIGLGKIGRAVLPKARGFGMEICAYDPYVADDIFELLGVERKYELAELLSDSDYITIHAPLSGETYHMINEETIRLMKRHAVIVNTARGAIIEESALSKALEEGRISGAGIDVLEKEPPEPSNPLIGRKDIILTPHIAWYSEESFQSNVELGMDELIRVLKGFRPRFIVNPEIYGKSL